MGGADAPRHNRSPAAAFAIKEILLSITNSIGWGGGGWGLGVGGCWVWGVWCCFGLFFGLW